MERELEKIVEKNGQVAYKCGECNKIFRNKREHACGSLVVDAEEHGVKV